MWSLVLRTNSSINLNPARRRFGVVADSEPLKPSREVMGWFGEGGIIDITPQCFVVEWGKFSPSFPPRMAVLELEPFRKTILEFL